MENGKRKTDHPHPLRDALSVGMMMLFLISCNSHRDPLVGRWTVEKVNVEFDENKSTPEMVRQYGEIERGNMLEISKDSILTFITGDDTLRGRCSLQGESLYCNGILFGKLKDGLLTTKTSTPIGEIEVIYKK